MATAQRPPSLDISSQQHTHDLAEQSHPRCAPEKAETGEESPKSVYSKRPIVSDGHENAHNAGKLEPPGADGVKSGEGLDPNIVDWDGPDDPDNPLNWYVFKRRLLEPSANSIADRSPLKKWGNIAVLSVVTFNVPLASTMFAPGVPQLLDDFDTHNESLATFVVSVYILGLAMYVETS